ncbi:SWIM zinc finger family protein [Actinokineospora sp.]|uniref:SWIM zinc finger family protein n=1 Tax=Actinokineospora sp. TaxID=1872133 RepID=UPI003D6B8BE1
MRLEPLSDHEWRRFLDQIAVQAGHIAALLDRDMPAELVHAAADAGVRLLPDIGDLDPECSCPGWEMPCRHAAALAYQVSWLLDADPFVLLLLRGKDEAELLGDLHGRSAAPATELATEVFAPADGFARRAADA